MSQHLLSLRYAFQNPITTTDSKTQALLLSIDGSTHQILSNDESHVWCVTGVGERLSSFWQTCKEGWELAQVDQNQRTLISADQPFCQNQWQENDPQWQDSLLAQLNSFKVILSEQENVHNTRTHLVLLLGHSLPPQFSPPTTKNINSFSSVTVIFEEPPLHILAWSRWAVLVGARLIFNNRDLSTHFANAIQTFTYAHPRFSIGLETGDSVHIQSITQLTPSTHSISVDPTQFETKLMTPPTAEGQRTSWFIHLNGDFSNLENPKTLLKCSLQDQVYEIQTSVAFQPHSESLNPSVAFANQLSHRAHCIEGILYAYQQNKLRRVLQYLDQWLKLSMAFETEESTRWLYEVKVRFLSLGTFQEADLHTLIHYGFAPVYHLSSSGQWQYVPYRFNNE